MSNSAILITPDFSRACKARASKSDQSAKDGADDIFQAFHMDTDARSRVVSFPNGLKRRGFPTG